MFQPMFRLENKYSISLIKIKYINKIGKGTDSTQINDANNIQDYDYFQRSHFDSTPKNFCQLITD